MKISWGVGITITIILFTVVSLFFMFFALSQDVNIVKDDYYEEELKFQDKIEKLKQASELTENIEVISESNKITFKFPSLFSPISIGGEIYLYRPSDRNLDISLPILLDSLGVQYLPTENLAVGLWKIQIDWQADNNSYFYEKKIMVH